MAIKRNAVEIQAAAQRNLEKTMVSERSQP